MKTQLFLLTILFLTSCSVFEDEDARTYYKVTGTGYVYNAETKEPEPYALIIISSNFESRPFGQVETIFEEYLANKNGFFKIRFLKRTQKCNVVGYSINAGKSDNDNSYKNFNEYHSKMLYFYSKDIKSNKSNTINLDTLWIRKI